MCYYSTPIMDVWREWGQCVKGEVKISGPFMKSVAHLQQ